MCGPVQTQKCKLEVQNSSFWHGRRLLYLFTKILTYSSCIYAIKGDSLFVQLFLSIHANFTLNYYQLMIHRSHLRLWPIWNRKIFLSADNFFHQKNQGTSHTFDFTYSTLARPPRVLRSLLLSHRTTQSPTSLFNSKRERNSKSVPPA